MLTISMLLPYILLGGICETLGEQFDLTRGESVEGVVSEVQQLLSVSKEEVENMHTLLEEVYGEGGTFERQPGPEAHYASFADSLNSLERVYAREAAMRKALQRVREAISGVLSERRPLPGQVLHLQKEEEILRLLAKSNKLPVERDLDQLAEGLVDVFLVSEQSLEKWGEGNLVLPHLQLQSPHRLQPEDWEQLAKAAATKGRLDLRISFLEQQLTGISDEEQIDSLKRRIQKEKDRHDSILIEFGRFGIGSNITRVDMKPYNLANKEVVRKSKAQRTQFKFRQRQVFPLHKDFEVDTGDPRSGLLDLYREEEITRLCQGKMLPAKKKAGKVEEVCKLVHHGQPALKLAPFKLSILATEPFISRVQVILSQYTCNAKIRFTILSFRGSSRSQRAVI